MTASILLRALSTHRRMAAALFLAPLLAALAWAFLRSPVYESAVTLAVGTTGDGKVVASPAALMKWLRVEYQITPWHKRRKFPRLESVGFGDRTDSTLIALRATAHTPGEARDFLAEVGHRAIERQRPLFEQLRAPLVARIKALDTEIANLQTQIEALSIGSAGSRDPGVAIPVAIERANLASTLTSLKQKQMDLQLRLSRALPTRLLSQPTLPELAIRPRPIPILITGLLIGLFAAIGGVLVAEARNKDEAP